jgi:hypothetical protein
VQRQSLTWVGAFCSWPQKKAFRSRMLIFDVLLCMFMTYLILTTVTMQLLGGQYDQFAAALANGDDPVRPPCHGALGPPLGDH